MPDRPILLKSRRDPLFGYTRAGLLQKLRSVLQDRAQAAYVFGSFATDSMDPDSDIDLIIIQDTTAPFVTRAFAFEDLLDIIPAMDILVYTEAEFNQLTTDPSPGFWTSVCQTLLRIV